MGRIGRRKWRRCLRTSHSRIREWTEITYTTDSSGTAALNIYYFDVDFDDVEGKCIIVHDSAGNPILCGVLMVEEQTYSVSGDISTSTANSTQSEDADDIDDNMVMILFDLNDAQEDDDDDEGNPTAIIVTISVVAVVSSLFMCYVLKILGNKNCQISPTKDDVSKETKSVSPSTPNTQQDIPT